MTDANGMIRVPETMRETHDTLHAALAAATEAPGRIGEAARRVARALHDHFEREEEIALPPLGLLRPLADGRFDRSMLDVLPMTDALREELPRMLEEHRAIRAAVAELADVAREEGDAERERLAERLRLHALEEEEVHYPAAILIGEVVRARAERADEVV